MSSIRKVSWASMASLALVFGCGSEETTTTSVPTPTPIPTTTTPTQTPATHEVKAPEKKADALKIETPKVDAPKVDAPKVDAPKVDAPKKADDSKLTADEIAEIKKLPAAEQAIALSQISCPVGGEHLGGMGVPIKVVAEGKTFFICCKSCQKEVDADPKAVLAKLAK